MCNKNRIKNTFSYFLTKYETLKKNYKLKDWHIKLIDNFSNYKAQKLTWKQIATEVDASWTAVETFVRRNEKLFEKKALTEKLESFTKEIDEFLENKKVTSKMPKILIFDIETAPLAGYFFRLWRQNIAPSQLLNGGNYFMLSWAAKWLFEDTILNDVLTPEEALRNDDTRIVKSIHKLLDEADIVVAHWGSGFDVPMLNARFIMKGLPPSTPYQLIDTKVHAAKIFSFPSNKLDYLAEQFGVGKKIKTDWELWEGCLKGDADSLHKMNIYCQHDVRLLEGTYLHMRSWIKPHPNVSLYIADNIERCPCCGHDELENVGNYYTTANTYEALRCTSCGHISRSRKSILTKEQKQNLVLSVPK